MKNIFNMVFSSKTKKSNNCNRMTSKPIAPTPPLYIKNAKSFVTNVKKEFNSKKTKKEFKKFLKMFE